MSLPNCYQCKLAALRAHGPEQCRNWELLQVLQESEFCVLRKEKKLSEKCKS